MKSKGTESYLMQRLIDLLDTKNFAQHQKNAQENGNKGSRNSLGSFNLLLSKRAMHLVPRTKEDYTIPGEWGEVEGKKLGELSVNAMGAYLPELDCPQDVC